MARARKCDRCGILYENYDGEVVHKKLKFNSIVLRDMDSNDDYFTRDGYDLCQPCSNELEKWLLGKEKTK